MQMLCVMQFAGLFRHKIKLNPFVQLIPAFVAQTNCKLPVKICRSFFVKIFLSFFVLCLWFGSPGMGQAPDASKTSGLDQLYLAKDDGTGNAGEPEVDFLTTDIPIFCVVVLDSNLPVTVKMNLVVVNVPGVRAETKVVSTRYTTKNNEDRVNFSGNPEGLWTAGKYRVDIYIDDKLVKKHDFEIRGMKTPVKSTSAFSPKTAVKARITKRPRRTQFARN